jgi:cytochrome c-type biogenesis protein CcmH
MLARALVMLGLAVLLLPALAFADPMDDAVRRVGLQLQCPVCEGQSVAESTSGLARDMRAQIRTRLEAGASDRQILDEFVASYGVGILSDPPKSGITLGVWLGPLFALLLGGVVVAVLLTSWRRPASAGASRTATVDPEVADEFQRFRGEYGR